MPQHRLSPGSDLTFLLRLFALGLWQQIGDVPQGAERQAECGSWVGGWMSVHCSRDMSLPNFLRWDAGLQLRVGQLL